MEIDQISVRERIKEVKEDNSMNQREFAQSIGIQQSDLSSYLSGKQNIGITLINRICLEYSINRHWMLTGLGDKKLDKKDSLEKSIEESETVKELMAAIKRRDEHVEALIRVNEKHADNFAELLRQMKKTDALKEDAAGCAGASGFSDK